MRPDAFKSALSAVSGRDESYPSPVPPSDRRRTGPGSRCSTGLARNCPVPECSTSLRGPAPSVSRRCREAPTTPPSSTETAMRSAIFSSIGRGSTPTALPSNTPTPCRGWRTVLRINNGMWSSSIRRSTHPCSRRRSRLSRVTFPKTASSTPSPTRRSIGTALPPRRASKSGAARGRALFATACYADRCRAPPRRTWPQLLPSSTGSRASLNIESGFPPVPA